MSNALIITFLAASAIVGYLLGSISFALIVGQSMYGTDVRKKGSGSAGATNVLRTLGKKAAILTTIGDILKGIAAYYIGLYLGTRAGLPQIGAVIGGFAAVLGHNYPIFFKFRGGKGVLSSLALCIMLDWRIALATLVFVVLTIVISRYVSLGSMVGISIYTIFTLVFSFDEPVKWIVCLLMTALIFIRHSANIQRLKAGNESKLF